MARKPEATAESLPTPAEQPTPPTIIPIEPPARGVAVMRELTAEERAHVESIQTVSARIRYLYNLGYTKSQITKLLKNAKGGVLLYQHVNNVLRQQLKGSSDAA
jgi:hypothetical protein